MDEIREVLRLCVVQGGQVSNLGMPNLAEELFRRSEPLDHCTVSRED
jgi:hypothetical protein